MKFSIFVAIEPHQLISLAMDLPFSNQTDISTKDSAFVRV